MGAIPIVTHLSPVLIKLLWCVRAAIQERCHNNGYQAGAELVEEILQEHLGEADGCEALPVFSHMVHTANRCREKTRPKNPDSLDFDLIEDCLPEGFLVGDIRVGERLLNIRQLLSKISKIYAPMDDGGIRTY
jgi:hypothetical protein